MAQKCSDRHHSADGKRQLPFPTESAGAEREPPNAKPHQQRTGNHQPLILPMQEEKGQIDVRSNDCGQDNGHHHKNCRPLHRQAKKLFFRHQMLCRTAWLIGR
ncbi:MAG: hypothetical protein Q7T68_01510 [Sphingopyxis sp.]|nr:hypothetical protein [Sphingopyxis sp.]